MCFKRIMFEWCTCFDQWPWFKRKLWYNKRRKLHNFEPKQRWSRAIVWMRRIECVTNIIYSCFFFLLSSFTLYFLSQFHSLCVFFFCFSSFIFSFISCLQLVNWSDSGLVNSREPDNIVLSERELIAVSCSVAETERMVCILFAAFFLLFFRII